MPFRLRSLAGLAYASGFTLWRYRSDEDAIATISAAGYFSEAAHLMRASDVVMTTATDGPAMLTVTQATPAGVLTGTLRGGQGGTTTPPITPPVTPPVTPPATGGDATSVMASSSAASALVTELPVASGLVLHVDAADPFGYGGALPADGSAVNFLLPRSGAVKGAVGHETLPGRPKFRANFDGKGRPALVFSAADAASMSADEFNVPGGFLSSDQAATFAAVLRLRTTATAAARAIAHVMPRNMTAGDHFPSGLLVLANGNLMFRMRDNFTASTDATFTWTPNTTETVIVVGRHPITPDRRNKLAVRQGGTTASITATGNSTATNYAYNGAVPQLPTSARIGGRRYNNGAAEDIFFDDYLCELAIWNFALSDQNVADLIATWRAKWGVA